MPLPSVCFLGTIHSEWLKKKRHRNAEPEGGVADTWEWLDLLGRMWAPQLGDGNILS